MVKLYIVNDAYLDLRFNKEIDLKTNYKTKTILCVPIKDAKGKSFGVIQAINKKEGLFSNEDEEIMEIFSTQASSVLTNTLVIEENYIYINLCKGILNLSHDLHNCRKVYLFVEICEEHLKSLWRTNKAIIWIMNEGKLVHYSSEKSVREVRDLTIGIIGKTIKDKILLAYNNLSNCVIYNKLVDLDSGLTVITFPILNDNNEIISIGQMEYPDVLDTVTNLPKNSDIEIVNYFSNQVMYWLKNYYFK